jgi:hypothetical protein
LENLQLESIKILADGDIEVVEQIKKEVKLEKTEDVITINVKK